ncbi:hypothetical protein DFH06DRAFT_1127578 [Mycena polygramma]|nr:hypothetical protein DFH06DRAFT_1127578 [Mycena polygramma]
MQRFSPATVYPEIGLFRHTPHFRVPVEEQPLTLDMVHTISALARKQHGAARYYCFPTASSTAEAIWVHPRGLGFNHKDLNLAHLFPNGCSSDAICVLPGTDLVLPVSWRIYIGNARYRSPLNECIKTKFDIDWPGNVVMVKRRRNSDALTKVSIGEEEFADVILELWLKEFIHVQNRLGLKLLFHSSV